MFRGTSNFDKLLEKATSHLLLEPDWNTILLLCDCIRQGDVQPKYAVNAVKKKLYAANPHVVLYALQVLESWVKNCGAPIHQEIATKQFFEELKELVKLSTNDSVKSKILELIQIWANAFRNDPNYRSMTDVMQVMKVEGYQFPAMKESDAMFVADQAPKWLDGEVCHRCRVQFNMVQRKHHCRHCGQVFCGKCSARNVSIPRLGFEKEVRVCEACYEKLIKPSGTAKPGDPELPAEYLTSSLAQQAQLPPAKNETELQEEEDLQLAIALSKSEAENKEKEKLRATSALLSMPTAATLGPIVSSAPSLDSSLDSDPELARYLNRPYWEQQKQHVDAARPDSIPSTLASSGGGGGHGGSSSITSHVLGGGGAVSGGAPMPSAPTSSSQSGAVLSPQSHFPVAMPMKLNDVHQNGEVDELDEFVGALRGHLEIFVNRIKSNFSRGRSITVDSTVQNIFPVITAMHSQLLRFIQQQDDKRVYFESLQDKLSQSRDARAALDALREDHAERLRREAEEAERQRQIQMAHKLSIMRKKKQEYLDYQRHLAMQRMQEQERELQLRQEQQKQHYMRGSSAGFQPPPPQQQQQQPQALPPPGSFHQSPVHHQHHPQQHLQGPPMAAPPSQQQLPPVSQQQLPPPPPPQQQQSQTAYQSQQYFPPPPAPYQQQQQQQPSPNGYQNFNMHDMATNLPPAVRGNFPSQPQQQQQQAPPPGMHPVAINQAQQPIMQSLPPGNLQISQGVHQPQMLPNVGPNVVSQPNPVQMQRFAEAELISFD